jgi:hypothetical protein
MVRNEYMLPRNQRQENISRAYVRAIAALPGVICGDVATDFGIDMYLRSVTERDGQYIDSGDQLDLQVKSSSLSTVTETEVVHDLEIRSYDVLRQNRPRCPRLLVLLVVPAEEGEWISQSLDELIIRRCAYWHSLRGAEPATTTKTTRITIPRTNVFSVEAVQRMMNALHEGRLP